MLSYNNPPPFPNSRHVAPSSTHPPSKERNSSGIRFLLKIVHKETLVTAPPPFAPAHIK